MGIWYVTGDMPYQEVAGIAEKKWGNPASALERLLQKQHLASNVVCAACVLWAKIEPGHPLSEARTLQKLLERLPVTLQADTFQQCMVNDVERAASILSQFAAPAPEGLFPVAHFIAQQWSDETRCDDLALQFFQSLQIYGVPQVEILWLLARAFISRKAFYQAELALQQLARIQPTAEVWWQLAVVTQALQKPPLLVLEMLSRRVTSAPQERFSEQALMWIGAIAHELLGGRSPGEEGRTNHTVRTLSEKLRAVIASFSLEERAVVFRQVCHNDDALAARLLVLLAIPVIEGLSNVACEIMEKWSATPRHDTIALQFFYFLPAYEVPVAKAHLLLSRALVESGLHVQAEQLLIPLTQAYPTPDILWLLCSVYHFLHRSPSLQLETLFSFIKRADADSRLAEAWNLVGNLYGEQVGHGMDAIQAYLRAEQLGMQHIPQLSSFRAGDWHVIPALRTHPDFAFPVIVAIDIEVDPQPGAKPGERIYEVAAVRMKGRTVIHQYQSYIKRPFRPAKLQTNVLLEQAPEAEDVASELRCMLGSALVVGHNVRNFDAEQLAGLHVPLAEDRIVDTLYLARLLYPDSLRHNLTLLCDRHGIDPDTDGEWHTALKDALACGWLLQVLGDEFLQRGQAFLNGVRALVAPGSAIDQAILQPRRVAADPSLTWLLDAKPARPHVLVATHGLPASLAMQEALQSDGDALVELHDSEAAYIRHLPTSTRVLVTTSTRSRLENMLAAVQIGEEGEEVYVLPDPATQLCPQRLRSLIERTVDADYRLLLFCLYQLSHNHDASALFPMRLPVEGEPAIVQLRHDLLRSCCATDTIHLRECPAAQAHLQAITSHRMLLATHEALAHQKEVPKAELIVIDDLAELQMHLPLYLARQIKSDRIEALQLTPEEQQALDHLSATLADCAQAYSSHAAFHERLSLRGVKRYLEDSENQEQSVLEHLQRAGEKTERLAQDMQKFFNEPVSGRVLQRRVDEGDHEGNEDEPVLSRRLHAYWLDVWFFEQDGRRAIERWAINGLNVDLEESFLARFWAPYQQHILCGSALVVDGKGATYLERSLGLPKGLPFLKDTRAATRVYIPPQHVLAPAGYLRRFSWALQLGSLLYSLQDQMQERSLIVTFNQALIAKALAQAFSTTHLASGRQILASSLGWTMAKIGERLADRSRKVLALVAPRTRSSYLNGHVDVEITGPLRFLNQDDPLVAAHMRAFAERYPADNPFHSYLLPQALLELKTRLSSDAGLHIILDSRLHARSYRDEVNEMLRGISIQEGSPDSLLLSELPASSRQEREVFLALLSQALQQSGLGTNEDVSDEELRLVLRKFWDHDDFRIYEKKDGAEKVSQLAVVRGVLEKRDQLMVVATGGGKSLCYQLPALLLADGEPPKVTIVFSPLIALMSDQIEELHHKGVFSAIVLNSSISAIQRQEHLEGLARGDYSIVYVAPEQIRSSALRRALEQREIGLIAVDEAHCLSQWGHDFRTDYFAVKDWIDRIAGESGRSFPILAMTATARQGHKNLDKPELSDEMSTVRDIIEKLDLKKRASNVQEMVRLEEEDAILTSPRRDELEFRVEQIVPAPVPCKCGSLLAPKTGLVICAKCQVQRRFTDMEVEEFVEKMKLQRLVRLLADRVPPNLRARWERPLGERQRGIIYCAYTATTEKVAAWLKDTCKGADLRIDFYHAGRDAEEKNLVLQRFKSDGEDGLDIVVATNAFGMGIDVRRLGFVIHFDVPGTPEAYYQEAGRAGRDEFFGKVGGEKALSILLYHPVDLGKQRYLNRQNAITSHQVLDVYDAFCEIRFPGVKHADEQREQEIIFTPQDIAVRAGVSEEQIGMLLYYLEYHAKLDGKPVLERGDTANHVFQIRFEKGYQSRCDALPAHSPSQPLLESFQKDGVFGLSEEATATISLQELAAHLGWKIARLERELLNLVQRRIVTYLCQGRVKWAKDASSARQTLVHLEQDILKLLRSINTKVGKRAGALLRGESVFADLPSLYVQLGLQAVPQKNLFHFLSALSHRDSDDVQLFKRFTRTVNRSHPGQFQLLLLSDGDTTIPEKLGYILSALRQTLLVVERQQRAGEAEESSEPDRSVELDLLKIEPDYRRRRRLHRQLLLLDTLGLLKYTSDPSLGLAMRVTFKQPYVPAHRLAIDLSTLHLKEMHEKHKLRLMEHYATELAESSREEEFSSYFFGAEPLVKPVNKVVRTDLSEEQQAILQMEKGFHLIEGPAGCGKTTALVEYIKYLVYQKYIPLERIMVTTHYNSATNRIAKALESLQEDGSVLFSTTINKFGEMIFRKYRPLLLRSDGKPYYERDPQLLPGNQELVDRKEQAVVSKALAHIYAATWQDAGWPKDLEPVKSKDTYQPNDELEKECLKSITLLRQYGIFPTSQVTRKKLAEALGHGKESDDFLSLRYAVYIEFLQLRSQEGYYTFDDQILFALAILRFQPGITREYQHFFEHVIVDELQDFTFAQAQLLLTLCPTEQNVLAFGDRHQEIRVKETDAASVFGHFARLSSGIHQLTQNYRSTQSILRLISFVRNFKEKQKFLPLQAVNKVEGELPIVLRLVNDGQQESKYAATPPKRSSPDFPDIEHMVAASLTELQRIPELERGSVALIAMKSNTLLAIGKFLRTLKISFTELSDKPLYQKHHVNRVLVYLRLIANQTQSREIEQLLRYNLVPYFEREQVQKLLAIATYAGWPLFKVLNNEAALNKARITAEQRFALQKHLALISHFRPASFVAEVVEELRALENGPFSMVEEYDQKRDDIARALDGLTKKTVVEAVAEIEQHLSFLEQEQQHSGLFITSIDHAKSEEFDTVFLLGPDYLEASILPRHQLSFIRRFYVSISRARKRLYMIVGDKQPHYSSLLTAIEQEPNLCRVMVLSPEKENSEILA